MAAESMSWKVGARLPLTMRIVLEHDGSDHTSGTVDYYLWYDNGGVPTYLDTDLTSVTVTRTACKTAIVYDADSGFYTSIIIPFTFSGKKIIVEKHHSEFGIVGESTVEVEIDTGVAPLPGKLAFNPG